MNWTDSVLKFFLLRFFINLKKILSPKCLYSFWNLRINLLFIYFLIVFDPVHKNDLLMNQIDAQLSYQIKDFFRKKLKIYLFFI